MGCNSRKAHCTLFRPGLLHWGALQALGSSPHPTSSVPLPRHWNQHSLLPSPGLVPAHHHQAPVALETITSTPTHRMFRGHTGSWENGFHHQRDSAACLRLRQKHWNKMLFILNGMDLLTCHPSVHELKSVYLPCMATAPESFPPLSMILYRFTSGPRFAHCSFQSFGGAVYSSVLVKACAAPQDGTLMPQLQLPPAALARPHLHCSSCSAAHRQALRTASQRSAEKFGFEPFCSNIKHLSEEDVELMSTDDISVKSTNSRVDVNFHLSLPNYFMKRQSEEQRTSAGLLQNHQVCDGEPSVSVLLLVPRPGPTPVHQDPHRRGEFTVLDQFWKYVLYVAV